MANNTIETGGTDKLEWHPNVTAISPGSRLYKMLQYVTENVDQLSLLLYPEGSRDTLIFMIHWLNNEYGS